MAEGEAARSASSSNGESPLLNAGKSARSPIPYILSQGTPWEARRGAFGNGGPHLEDPASPAWAKRLPEQRVPCEPARRAEGGARPRRRGRSCTKAGSATCRGGHANACRLDLGGGLGRRSCARRDDRRFSRLSRRARACCRQARRTHRDRGPLG